MLYALCTLSILGFVFLVVWVLPYLWAKRPRKHQPDNPILGPGPNDGWFDS
jgi:hypothetical protein